MSPGIYWIGGGGVSVKTVGGESAGDGVLVAKDIGDNTVTPIASGGVLIYNTADPVASTCVAGRAPAAMARSRSTAAPVPPCRSGRCNPASTRAW
jgi:hypothetical protein